jgi:ubiquitin carboxyl-terminal hydrolase L3
MEGESPFEWPPLESNPEVFTDYMHTCGLPADWIVAECFGLTEDCLSFVPKPVLAVIATFETVNDPESRQLGSADTEISYYMKQTGKLDNACGVIACLHSILNNLGAILI